MAEPLAAALAAALALAPGPAGPSGMSERPARPVLGDMSEEPAQAVPGDMSEEPSAVVAAPAPTRTPFSPELQPGPDPLRPDLPLPLPLPPAPAVEGPAPAPAPAPVSTPIPTDACRGSRPCKRLVILAAVSGAVGLGTVIAGVVVATRPVRVDPRDPTMAIAYRPAGAAVLAIGVGVLATSLLMSLTAVRASRQAQKRGFAARLPRPVAAR